MIHGHCPNCASSAEEASAGGNATSFGDGAGVPHKSSWSSKASRFAIYILIVILGRVGRALLIDHIAQRRYIAQMAELRHRGSVAPTSELKGSGRIYLVQLGPKTQPYSLDDFARWLHAAYALNVDVLPALPLEPAELDPSRTLFGRPNGTYIAELLYDRMKSAHPDLAADPGAYLIGITDAPMDSVRHRWASTFTERDLQRAAVISTHGMEDDLITRLENHEAAVGEFQARVRRILLKDVAVLFWKLPLNQDQTSLLGQPLEPDIPADRIYESDLDPARTGSGQYEGEPCLFLAYTQSGVKPIPGPLIRTCSDVDFLHSDEDTELFEVDLRLGLLIDRHTDFDLPDSIPIEFERATRDGWSGRNAFGISGSHNYDEFLSSADNIQISVIHADTVREGLVRVPRDQTDLDRAKYVDTDYSSNYYEMRWRSGPFARYELKRYDGSVKTFLPCYTPQQLCYLTGYRNPLGQELKFERDGGRSLMRLTSPNGSWLRFNYEANSRVSEIDDSRGRTVKYEYDGRGRLVRVTYPSKQVFSYTYDDTQHMLTFSVARDAKAAPVVLLRNEYANGKLIRQTMEDGQIYTYAYRSTDGGPTLGAEVHGPSGAVFMVDIQGDESVVRER